MRSFQKLFWIGVALSLTGAAFGAAPPPADPDPVEPHGFIDPCTAGNHEEMHVECVFCEATQTAPCKDRFGSKGYTKKCQTRAGHSQSRGEVWCLEQRPQPKAEAPQDWLGIAGSIGLVFALGAAGYYVFKRRSAR